MTRIRRSRLPHKIKIRKNHEVKLPIIQISRDDIVKQSRKEKNLKNNNKKMMIKSSIKTKWNKIMRDGIKK